MHALPPLAKLSERLLVEVEQAVRRFGRYHRYATGADLRRQAAEVCRLVNRAWRDKPNQLHFTEHELKAKRYLRYVDDFVLIHHDRAQLQEWCVRIERFLADRLKLSLKDDVRLRPLGDGIDFLGYIVYPTHTRVRRRVVDHARTALDAFQRRHVTRRGLRATPEQLRAVQGVWASYEGHLQHADAHRLRRQFHSRYPWLSTAMQRRRLPARLDRQTLLLPFPKDSRR